MTEAVAAAIPFFVATMAIEARLLRSRPDLAGYGRRDTRASLLMGAGNVVVNGVVAIAELAVLGWILAHAPVRLDASSWKVQLGALVGVDFCYYWFHRLHHDVRILWAAHVNHHSSERYNLSTALRQSWTTPITGAVFYWPLALVGFEPWLIMAARAVDTLYQYWIHTELVGRMGALEAVLNTPSHHRVHHGTEVEYLDRNHGGILIVWDRLFGTFEPERAPVHYGITRNLDTFRPVEIAFHEWKALLRDLRRARSPREALGYAFAPPGWSPDGSTLTSDQRRALARGPGAAA